MCMCVCVCMRMREREGETAEPCESWRSHRDRAAEATPWVGRLQDVCLVHRLPLFPRPWPPGPPQCPRKHQVDRGNLTAEGRPAGPLLSTAGGLSLGAWVCRTQGESPALHKAVRLQKVVCAPKLPIAVQGPSPTKRILG